MEGETVGAFGGASEAHLEGRVWSLEFHSRLILRMGDTQNSYDRHWPSIDGFLRVSTLGVDTRLLSRANASTRPVATQNFGN